MVAIFAFVLRRFFIGSSFRFSISDFCVRFVVVVVVVVVVFRWERSGSAFPWRRAETRTRRRPSGSAIRPDNNVRTTEVYLVLPSFSFEFYPVLLSYNATQPVLIPSFTSVFLFHLVVKFVIHFFLLDFKRFFFKLKAAEGNLILTNIFVFYSSLDHGCNEWYRLIMWDLPGIRFFNSIPRGTKCYWSWNRIWRGTMTWEP